MTKILPIMNTDNKSNIMNNTSFGNSSGNRKTIANYPLLIINY